MIAHFNLLLNNIKVQFTSHLFYSLLDSNAVCRAASASLPNNQQPSYKETRQTFYPSANIMPSRTCYVLFEDDGQLVVQPMLWGLIPPWAEKVCNM